MPLEIPHRRCSLLRTHPPKTLAFADIIIITSIHSHLHMYFLSSLATVEWITIIIIKNIGTAASTCIAESKHSLMLYIGGERIESTNNM